MNRLISARNRVAVAADLPALLDAAYEAFEDMLAVLRRHQEEDDAVFAAFVVAAAAAANGRDWIAAAEALPSAAARDQIGDLSDETIAVDIARAVAELSNELADRLAAVAASSRSAGDWQYCQSAAAEAVAITTLLGGASSP